MWFRPIDLEVAIPTVENFVHFDVKTEDDMSDEGCNVDRKEILCILEFSSSQPVSISDYITFSDIASGKRYDNKYSNVQHLQDLYCMDAS